MTVLAKTTNGSVLTFTLNEFPNLSPGLKAPVGSEARVMKNNAGSTWSKYRPGDTEWKNLDDSDIKDSILFYEDWFSSSVAGKNALLASNATSGSSNTTTVPSSGNIMGVLTLASAGLLNSYAFVTSATSNNGHLDLLNKETVFETLVQVPVNFSDKLFTIGLGKTIGSTEHSNGVYFRYRGSDSGNWQCRTANNSVRTNVTTTVPVVAGQNYTLKFVTRSNVVMFYIDNVLVATITTNIPTTSLFVSMGISTLALLDLVTRQVHIDYFSLKINLDIPRI